MKRLIGGIGVVAIAAMAITIYNAGGGKYSAPPQHPAPPSAPQTGLSTPAVPPAFPDVASAQESPALKAIKNRALSAWDRDWPRVIEVTSGGLRDPQFTDSDRVTLLLYRARAYAEIKQREPALADYRAAAALDGSSGYTALAGFHFEEADYSAADRAYQLAVDAKGDQDSELTARASYAWFLAVCPDKAFRSGERALALVEKGLTIADGMQSITALYHFTSLTEAGAAAYAEQGKFTDAVKMTDALSEMKAKGGIFVYLRPGHEERRAAYKAGKPWYQAAKK